MSSMVGENSTSGTIASVGNCVGDSFDCVLVQDHGAPIYVECDDARRAQELHGSIARRMSHSNDGIVRAKVHLVEAISQGRAFYHCNDMYVYRPEESIK